MQVPVFEVQTMDANLGEISATFKPIHILFLLSHPVYNHHTSINRRTTKLEHNDIIINSDQEKLRGMSYIICIIILFVFEQKNPSLYLSEIFPFLINSTQLMVVPVLLITN